MSAPWLLTIGERTGQLQPGLYERIAASYARRGVGFEQFVVEEGEQPRPKRRKTAGRPTGVALSCLSSDRPLTTY